MRSKSHNGYSHVNFRRMRVRVPVDCPGGSQQIELLWYALIGISPTVDEPEVEPGRREEIGHSCRRWGSARGAYRPLLRKEPEGRYTVTVPTLPGCVTYGETVDEAIAMAREAIEVYIEGLLARGEDIPTENGLLEYRLTVEVRV